MLIGNRFVSQCAIASQQIKCLPNPFKKMKSNRRQDDTHPKVSVNLGALQSRLKFGCMTIGALVNRWTLCNLSLCLFEIICPVLSGLISRYDI